MYRLLYRSKTLHLAGVLHPAVRYSNMQGKHNIVHPAVHSVTAIASRHSTYRCACRCGSGRRKDERKVITVEEDICKSAKAKEEADVM